MEKKERNNNNKMNHQKNLQNNQNKIQLVSKTPLSFRDKKVTFFPITFSRLLATQSIYRISYKAI